MPPLADGIYFILKKAGKVFVAANGKRQHELSLNKEKLWLT